MASTYSNLKIQLMATGENSGTWGNVTNVNLGTAIEQAMVETATVTFASANVTLTLTDTNAAQNARALRLNLTGTTGGARDLIVPAVQKPYIVNNGTADTITVKVSGQTGVPVPASKTMLVYNNGTDVVDAINHLSALSLATALPISSGGTGSTSTTYANLESNVSGTLPVANGGTSATTLNAEAVVVGNGTSAVKFVAPGTDGNVLTSNGTAWVSEAIVIPPSVPTGTVAAFAGDPGSDWLECNGQVVSQSTYSDLYAKVGLIADALHTDAVTFSDLAYQNTGFYSLAYGNSTWVAGTEAGATNNLNYTSTDGITWTARSFGWVAGTSYPGNIIYSDKFVATMSVGGTAASNSLYFATSTDGITWTQRTLVGFGGAAFRAGLAYNGSTFVAVSADKVATSADGITWTIRTLAVTSLATNYVAYGNNVFVTAGYGSAPYRPTVQTSTDGITWTYRSVGWPQCYPSLIRYVNDKFYMFMTGGGYYFGSAVFTSTDGITWAEYTTLKPYLPSNVNEMWYDSINNLLYAQGSTSKDYSSQTGRALAVSADNGVTWHGLKLGARVIQTATDSGFPSSNNGAYPEAYSVLSTAGKTVLVGGMGIMGSDGIAIRSARWIKTITTNYTYQTDTQFILPFAHGPSKIMNYGENDVFKTSLAGLDGGVAGINLKYYIKT